MPKYAMSYRRIIVNADDLGLHPAVNAAIGTAFARGMLTSASAIVTGPAIEAGLLQVARRLGMPIGLHVALTSGRPCADLPLIPDLVDEHGQFRWRAGPLFRALSLRPPARLLDQIRIEVRAQFSFARSFALRWTHFDSHQHVHMIPAVFAILAEEAPRFEISRCRMVREPLSLRTMARRGAVAGAANAVKWGLTRVLGAALHNPLHSPHLFFGLLASGGVDRLGLLRFAQRLRHGQVGEVCIHPAEATSIADSWEISAEDRRFASARERKEELQLLLDHDLPAVLSRHSVKLISFAEI